MEVVEWRMKDVDDGGDDGGDDDDDSDDDYKDDTWWSWVKDIQIKVKGCRQEDEVWRMKHDRDDGDYNGYDAVWKMKDEKCRMLNEGWW